MCYQGQLNYNQFKIKVISDLIKFIIIIVTLSDSNTLSISLSFVIASAFQFE